MALALAHIYDSYPPAARPEIDKFLAALDRDEPTTPAESDLLFPGEH